MKNGKAEVLDVIFEDNGDMRVILAGRNDLNLFIKITREICAPGTIFQILSDTEVLCKLPRLEFGNLQ
jgi:hypothetical protein